MAKFKPSAQQERIVKSVMSGHDTCVIARAGTGKSSTLELICEVLGGKSAVYLAFNSDPVAEMRERLKGTGVEVRTLSSMGWGAIAKALGRPYEPNKDKNGQLAVEYSQECQFYSYPISRLAGLCKNTLIEPTNDNLAMIAIQYQVDVEPEQESIIFGGVRYALEKALFEAKKHNIDYDDMLYLPAKYNMPLPRYDVVLIDEAQDLNQTQIELVKKLARGQIVYVGDPAQAIYAFRGADSHAMENITNALIQMGRNPEILPLTVTRRCPKSVVKEAQRYVKDIEASDDAPEGEVITVDYDKMEMPRPGTMFICRNNAPLMPMAYALLKERVPVMVRGKDIGKGLLALIKKLRAKDIDSLIIRLASYRTAETDKISKRFADRPSRMDDALKVLNDKVECLNFMASQEKTIDGLRNTIEHLFQDMTDKASIVVLSTIHKAKGLEAETVYWLRLKKEFSGAQEDNLRYVAITRAKKKLVIVNP